MKRFISYDPEMWLLYDVTHENNTIHISNYSIHMLDFCLLKSLKLLAETLRVSVLAETLRMYVLAETLQVYMLGEALPSKP